jgi:diguanylate cyclase (GGDEF)-like protein/PAS domain S-box-containing protein
MFVKQHTLFKILISLILIVGTWHSRADSEIKRVLVLNSYHEGYHWIDRIMSGIHSVFDEHNNIELFINYMDTKRISDDTHFEQLYTLYKHKYQSMNIDAIVSTDDHALNFLLKYRDELFPEVPVFFNGINDYQPSRIEGQRNITGIAETYDAKGTIDMMLKIHPKTTEIAVISDTTHSGDDFRGLIERTEDNFSDRINFNYLTDLTTDNLLQTLANLGKNTLVLWVHYLRTPDGLSFSSEQSIRLVSSNSIVPTYCLYDLVGLGVVGGKINNPFNHGKSVAEMSLNYLNGTKIEDIPIITNPPLTNQFDFKVMQHFGINEKALPTKNIIINKPDSAYEKYKQIIWGFISFLLVLIIIITILSYYIRKQKQAEEELQKSEERFRALYYDNPSMYFTIDVDGTVISVNQYGAEQLGYTTEELIGNSVFDVFVEEDKQTVAEYIQTCISEPEIIHRWNLRKRCKDDQIIWVREAARVIFDTSNTPSVLIVCEDITESHKLSEELSYQASHDTLTGLSNRREFEMQAEQLLAATKTDHSVHSLCFMDLDQFKVINDTCGHIAGDEMLRQLTSVLKEVVRQNDTLARLGGDEFGILMQHCPLDNAQKVASTLLKAIQEYQFFWEDQSFKVGVSMGLVEISKLTPNLTELLMDADAACYIAKETGRNRIHVYHTEDSEIANRHGEMQWVTRIHKAIDKSLFSLYAQAIVPLDQRSGKHYEILIRMNSPDGDDIAPGAFLPAAERYNLISKLDSWVIEKTFSVLINNPDFLNYVDNISINLSGQSLSDNSLLDFISEQFTKTGIDGNKICFEITETAAISNLNIATKFISTLKEIGCKFALDDFGSGLSSFGYLKNLPVDYLKIDGMFVKDIIDDPIDHAMVKSINEIGHVMGMKTIAEFVENDVIKGMLREIGVDYGQGYGISMPQPLENIINDYKKNESAAI